MNRDQLRKQAEETQEILSLGCYETQGELFLIEDFLKKARFRSCLIDPKNLRSHYGLHAPTVEVQNCTTLEAMENKNALVLNFASGRRAGGGWLSGGDAQEESLARASGLVPCLDYPRFYESRSPLYSDFLIHSPDVPVFRSAKGDLIPPYLSSFVTIAAVNSSVGIPAKMKEVMSRRILSILRLARNYPTLILGAWGCGVFKNPPELIAELFAYHLLSQKEYAGHVIFAISDSEMAKTFEKYLA